MSFTTTRRVDFGDTDMAGIVHFANFFRYMESAEIDFLHSIGFTVSWREGDVKWGFPRVSAACDYRKPARFEDVLTIVVTVEKLGAKSVSYRFDFSNQRGEAIAVGRITSVFCRSDGPDHLESVALTAGMKSKLLPG
jgi:YbgC/YbaW family acyl-CoA thioester hydrolase